MRTSASKYKPLIPTLLFLAAVGLRCDSQFTTSLNTSGLQTTTTTVIDPLAAYASGDPVTTQYSGATIYPIYGVSALPGVSCAVAADQAALATSVTAFGYDSFLGTLWGVFLSWEVDAPPIAGVDGSGNCYLAANDTLTDSIVINKVDVDGTVTESFVTIAPFGSYTAISLTHMVSDSNGNAYVTGYLTKSSGYADGFVRKYNSSGSLVYTNTFSSTTADVHPRGITVDIYGNMYMGGSVGTKLFVTQFDASGGQVWNRLIKNTSFGAIHIDPLLQLTVLGYAPSTSDPSITQGVILRYDAYGNSLWTPKIWAYPDSLRSFDTAYPFLLTAAADGSFYVGASVLKDLGYVPSCGLSCGLTGQFINTFPYITKFDSNGSALWSQGFLPQADVDAPLQQITVDANGIPVAYGRDETNVAVYTVAFKP